MFTRADVWLCYRRRHFPWGSHAHNATLFARKLDHSGPKIDQVSNGRIVLRETEAIEWSREEGDSSIHHFLVSCCMRPMTVKSAYNERYVRRYWCISFAYCRARSFIFYAAHIGRCCDSRLACNIQVDLSSFKSSSEKASLSGNEVVMQSQDNGWA